MSFGPADHQCLHVVYVPAPEIRSPAAKRTKTVSTAPVSVVHVSGPPFDALQNVVGIQSTLERKNSPTRSVTSPSPNMRADFGLDIVPILSRWK